MVTRKQQGFTIIEVVLVLAIAGLIFLMVFIALPALNRGQRDTQRRNDVSRFSAQVTQYQSNNKGDVPDTFDATSATSFITKYMNNEWKDPTGDNYDFVAAGTAKDDLTGLTKAGQWTYASAKVCSGETMTTGGTRNYVIAMKLEGSGTYCKDNK